MTTTDIRATTAPQPSRGGELMRRFTKSSGWLARPLAGRRFITIWATMRYRGRRSGNVYAIPVAIGVTSQHFVVPMPWAGAQWVRNVLAAGECTIRWNGSEWHATEPVVIEREEARNAFGPIARQLIPRVGISRFLRLRRVGIAAQRR